VGATIWVFLSYAREDRERVEDLYQELSRAGFKPWMDTKDILPGERWEASIRMAIRRSDFFLACLSSNSVNKRGFLQKEIKSALDICQEMLDSDIYLIPVRLEDCQVPASLRDFQWVNLFKEDGWARLIEAIQVGMERRAQATKESIIKHYQWDVEEAWNPDSREQALRDLTKRYIDRRQWQLALETALRRIDVLPFTKLATQHRLNTLERTGREELVQLYVRWAEDDLAIDNLKGAVDSYRKAEQVCSEVADWQGVREIRYALAETYSRWAEAQVTDRRWADAVGHYRSALALYEQLESPAKIALIWYRLGQTRKEQGREREALSCFTMSLEYRKDNKGEFLVPLEIILSAHTQVIKTRLVRREFHHAILQLCEKADDLIEAGLAQDAIAPAREALHLSRHIQAPRLVLDSQCRLVRALGEGGNPDQAIGECKTALALCEELGDENTRNEVLEYLDRLRKRRFPRLRVFISSTIQDLQIEREAVERAIANLRLEAVRPEKMGAPSMSPREAIRIMVQECDVYIGILGGRYGYILPEAISVTEFEFNTARKAGRPILLYRKQVAEEELERAQKAFIERVGDFNTGYYIREFNVLDVPDRLIEWVQQDVLALLAGEFHKRMPGVRMRPGPSTGS
jgi:tetratricopeptide (TPR) repeat protein